MKRTILLVAAGVFGALASSPADILWDQPREPGPDEIMIASQVFPDFPGSPPPMDIFAFDDLVVDPAGWAMSRITIWGGEFLSGDPRENLDVLVAFYSDHDITLNPLVGPFHGVLDRPGGSDTNLIFDFDPKESIAGGNYWMAAWVVRPFNVPPGGQWGWSRKASGVGFGDEYWVHNPGEGFGFGPDPLPGSDPVFHNPPFAPADLAFMIEGQVVPEPASMLALGAGLALIAARRRRR
ncbi:MAG: PEP-CTERM sorting domain-containing protein [Armatimonadetes bacterium]|nr:PEP-CTERM sorting domain-containing protein [Armatimonadota bacterium]